MSQCVFFFSFVKSLPAFLTKISSHLSLFQQGYGRITQVETPYPSTLFLIVFLPGLIRDSHKHLRWSVSQH